MCCHIYVDTYLSSSSRPVKISIIKEENLTLINSLTAFQSTDIFTRDRLVSLMMTASRSTLLLFGDQTAQIGHTIKRLYRQSRRSILLQTLFQKTTDALQCQTSKLQPFERQRFFSFESILGLAETYAETGVLDIAVSTVLLCIAQLGSLIM